MIKKFNIYLAEIERERYKKNNPFLRVIVQLESFYITEFITKYLRKSKIKNLEINGKKIDFLGINLSSHKSNINLDTRFDYKTLFYESKVKYSDIIIYRETKRAEKFLNIIEESIPFFNKFDVDIGDEIQNSINLFRKKNYKNIWTYQKKRLKGIGIAKLICELTITEFTLDLVIDNKDEIVYKKRLIVTRPDSSLYYQDFKTLQVDEKTISVTDRIFEKPFFTITIKDMLLGKEGIFLNSYQELLDTDDEYAVLVMQAKNKVEWWTSFKECIQRPEVSCPKCPKLHPL